MTNCKRCGRPSQRELCVLCQHDAEMERRQQAHGVIVPREERQAAENAGQR